MARLEASAQEREQRRGAELRARLLEALRPWESLLVGGQRVDLAAEDFEAELAATREEMAQIILAAAAP